MRALRVLSFDLRLSELPKSQGTARGVNRKAAYLETETGVLIGICPAEVGNGPHLIVVEGYSALYETVQVGERFSWDGQALTVSQRLRLDVLPATAWAPRASFSLQPGWEGRLASGKNILAALGDSPAGERVQAREVVFLDVVAKRQWLRLDKALVDLIGLGPGLTPAGDDFLAAFLGGLNHLQAGLPEIQGDFKILLKGLETALPGRTHPLSEFYLRQFAAGYTTQVYQEVLAGLLERGQEGALREGILRLVATGATTGAELLRGMLHCLEYIANSTV